MILIDNIKETYNNKSLLSFLHSSQFNSSNNKKMVGVTLDNKDNFILKFYLELTSIYDIDKVPKFKKLVNKLKNKIDFKTPTSFATGVKLKSNGNYADYVHFKFGRNLKLLPKTSKLKFIGTNNCNFGLSVEKSQENNEVKKYFYYSSLRDKELIKKLFNFKLNVEEVNHFEVYETKSNVKVNVVYDFYKENINFLEDNNLLYFKHSVEVFNTFFNRSPKYYGLDKNKNLSFYYSFTGSSLNDVS